MTASKTVILSASLAALLLAGATSASAQSYGYGRANTGGGLGSVVSCDAPGNKQAGGAVIGALLGAVAGGSLSRNDRTAGSLIGAAVGAAAGSYVGCRQQRNEDPRGYGYDGRQVYGQAAYGQQQPYRQNDYRQGRYESSARYDRDDGRYDRPQSASYDRGYGYDQGFAQPDRYDGRR